MTPLPPDVPPVEAPVAAHVTDAGTWSTKAAMPWWRSPAIWGARVATLIPPLVALAVSFGWLTVEQAAAIGGLLAVVGGIVAEWGRRNGAEQPAPIKQGLIT